jgi:prepilin-type N-terminal cleavage/methylation domain-containing protein
MSQLSKSVNKRSWRFVVKGFRVRYVLLNLLQVCLGIAVWAVLVFGPLVVKLLSPGTPEPERTDLASIFLALHSTAWFGFALLVLMVALSLIVQSKRVEGRLASFSHVFESLRRGDLTMRVKLHERDYLHDEAAGLDRAVRAVRRRIGVLKGRAGRTETELEALRVAIAAGTREQVDRAFERIVHEAARTRTQLNGFITESRPEPGISSSKTADGQKLDVGFTLVEILLTVAIAGTLAAIAIPAYERALETARVVRAIADIRVMARSIQADELMTGELADSLDDAGLSQYRDPWGQPYVYLPIAGKSGNGGVRKDRKLNPINSDFDLYSMGRDKVTKTQLTNKDSLDDIVRANDGGFVGLAEDF